MGNVLANRCRARSEWRYNRLQEDRINGQRALRTLVEDKRLTEVDWHALIQKADELHRMEKRELEKSDIKWRRKQRRNSSIESSTSSSSIYLLDEATFPTTHDVATEVARILHSLESMANSSQPLDIDPKVAGVLEGTEPTTALSLPRCVSVKSSKLVNSVEPIDMVHMISKYSTSSDDDESSYRLNRPPPIDVEPDISKLTDDEEMTEHFDMNHPQFRSPLGVSYYNKSIFSKSLAPDGSYQITL